MFTKCPAASAPHVALRLREIDFDVQAAALRQRVARLVRSYMPSRPALGPPWWLLWIPLATAVTTMARTDIARVPTENRLAANITVGLISVLPAVINWQWARRSSQLVV